MRPVPTASVPSLLIAAALAACGNRPRPDARNAPDAPDAPVASRAPPSSTAQMPSEPSIAPEPADAGFWPTRVCTTGPGVLLVEKQYGCDRDLACTASLRGRDLDLAIPGGQRACKDSFPLVSVRCALPRAAWPSALASYRITVNGQPAIERVEIRPDGSFGVASCRESTVLPSSKK